MPRHSQVSPRLATQVLRSLDLFPPLMRFTWSRWRHIYADDLFPLTYLPTRQISLKITNLCNLRCKMCGQWGLTGYNWHKSVEELRTVVSVETYKKMVDDVAHLRPIIYIWGGEPMMYPGLFEVTGYIKKHEFPLAVVTNGLRLAENAERIVQQGWDALMLSLDGPREVHDEIRGAEGTFDNLMAGIAEVKLARRLQGKARPLIMLLTTVTTDNAPVFDQIFEVAEGLKPDIIVAYYSWFTTEERGLEHQRIFKEKLDCDATAWKGYVFPFELIDAAALQGSVKRIWDKRWGFQHLFIPDLKLEQIPRYYAEPGESFGYGQCIAPWITAEVMPNGDVAMCRDYPDYILGNIREESIVDIFNNDRATRFREVLREEKGFPLCARCCGLMGM